MSENAAAPKCLGCGHAKTNHVNGRGPCLVRSCRLCLIYQPVRITSPGIADAGIHTPPIDRGTDA